MSVKTSLYPEDAEKIVLPGKFFENVGEVAWGIVFWHNDVNLTRHNTVLAAYVSFCKKEVFRPLVVWGFWVFFFVVVFFLPLLSFFYSEKDNNLNPLC